MSTFHSFSLYSLETETGFRLLFHHERSDWMHHDCRHQHRSHYGLWMETWSPPPQQLFRLPPPSNGSPAFIASVLNHEVDRVMLKWVRWRYSVSRSLAWQRESPSHLSHHQMHSDQELCQKTSSLIEFPPLLVLDDHPHTSLNTRHCFCFILVLSESKNHGKSTSLWFTCLLFHYNISKLAVKDDTVHGRHPDLVLCLLMSEADCLEDGAHTSCMVSRRELSSYVTTTEIMSRIIIENEREKWEKKK